MELQTGQIATHILVIMIIYFLLCMFILLAFDSFFSAAGVMYEQSAKQTSIVSPYHNCRVAVQSLSDSSHWTTIRRDGIRHVPVGWLLDSSVIVVG